MILLAVGNLPTAHAGTLTSTRIASFAGTESNGIVTLTGNMQYRDASGNFHSLNGTKVDFYWSTAGVGSLLVNYLGEIYSNDGTSSQPGAFSFTWVHGLEPGTYNITGKYDGGFYNGYQFDSCHDSVRLAIRLRLSIALDNPTVSLSPAGSKTLKISITAANSNNPHPVSLSINNANNFFQNETFSSTSGNTPFNSYLTLNNFTLSQPGTYTITILAASREDNSVTVTAPVLVFVQQNTRQISVQIQGLPPNVQTPLSLDGNFLTNLVSGTEPLTLSNQTQWISVQSEIDAGDTIYVCQVQNNCRLPASDPTITAFTFPYVTEYRLRIRGDLPPNIVSNLILMVNGTDEGKQGFSPTQGFSSFYLQNTVVDFAITPTYITTTEVNYNFTGWIDLTAGQTLSATNKTASGLYEITLSRPYSLEATYDKWALVTIKSNLPSDMSIKLQIGMAGSTLRTAIVAGSVAYPAGAFLVGSTFECMVGQDQLVVLSTDGNTRYEFQGMDPPSPITLVRHMTVTLSYAAKYRVEVVSQFPGTVLKPSDGVGWYAPGDLATLQVTNDARDKYGIPYIFAGWSGAVSSNETILTFPVTSPMEVDAQWRPDWNYLLMFAGVIIGITIPSLVITKKKIGTLRRVSHLSKKKSIAKPQRAKGKTAQNKDLDLYNYIKENGGSLSVTNAMAELGMNRDEITEAIRRLKATQRLR